MPASPIREYEGVMPAERFERRRRSSAIMPTPEAAKLSPKSCKRISTAQSGDYFALLGYITMNAENESTLQTSATQCATRKS